MVAKIESGKSLTGALHYNENKVSAGKAKLLATSGYIKSDHLLSFQDKLFRLTDLAGKNIRTKTNAVHLSLNFDVNEKIEEEKLIAIAGSYMDKIGFGDQPYLIYRHFDAGHPHIHVLTTNIQKDGSRISLNNIGKNRSEPARKAIENEYGLVKAGEKKQEFDHAVLNELKPIEYGKSDTKRAISNVVNYITKAYKFTSLPELNAILNLYNLTAYQGSKESTMYKNGGLNYWVTDGNGIRVGVPIKASSIYKKPTLKLLEERFRLNEYLRKPFKEALKNRIDMALSESSNLHQFQAILDKDQIALVVRQNADGRVYGLSYIDKTNKAIFNGSDLGKPYSAGAIGATLSQKNADEPIHNTTQGHASSLKPITSSIKLGSGHEPGGRTILDDLLNPLEANFNVPEQFGPKKKKKKRRKLNL